MDWKKAFTEIEEIELEETELKNKLSELRKRELSIRRDLSNYWGEKYTGFKIGDIIQWTEKSWRGKESTVKMVIKYFSAYIRHGEYEEDKKPSIHGIRILKNGEVGERTESVYDHQNYNPVKIGHME